MGPVGEDTGGGIGGGPVVNLPGTLVDGRWRSAIGAARRAGGLGAIEVVTYGDPAVTWVLDRSWRTDRRGFLLAVEAEPVRGGDRLGPARLDDDGGALQVGAAAVASLWSAAACFDGARLLAVPRGGVEADPARDLARAVALLEGLAWMGSADPAGADALVRRATPLLRVVEALVPGWARMDAEAYAAALRDAGATGDGDELLALGAGLRDLATVGRPASVPPTSRPPGGPGGPRRRRARSSATLGGAPIDLAVTSGAGREVRLRSERGRVVVSVDPGPSAVLVVRAHGAVVGAARTDGDGPPVVPLETVAGGAAERLGRDGAGVTVEELVIGDQAAPPWTVAATVEPAQRRVLIAGLLVRTGLATDARRGPDGVGGPPTLADEAEALVRHLVAAGETGSAAEVATFVRHIAPGASPWLAAVGAALAPDGRFALGLPDVTQLPRRWLEVAVRTGALAP
ncbi:MAG TPA: hypothetical protein VGO60_17990 [Iamia sp.]|nr:hypothetical protein [Iamia sp.]